MFTTRNPATKSAEVDSNQELQGAVHVHPFENHDEVDLSLWDKWAPSDTHNISGSWCDSTMGMESLNIPPMEEATLLTPDNPYVSLQVNVNSLYHTPAGSSQQSHQVYKPLSPFPSPPSPPPVKRMRGRPRKRSEPTSNIVPSIKMADQEPTTKTISNEAAAQQNRILAKERLRRLENDLAIKDDIILRQTKTIEQLNLQILEDNKRFESILNAKVDLSSEDKNPDVDRLTNLGDI
ncbi:Transcription initiation factor TFIID subunit 1 [Folsomia candida]|uniref:Transcription initiation factor TFIID subunit 1 n=1 Tax=Folsomia candida TaxID=158441 RepID=A0A226D4L3_FOLCA|nr:Transcription initiation factor TFIID subunit 1 [Folsomia candida]